VIGSSVAFVCGYRFMNICCMTPRAHRAAEGGERVCNFL